MKTRAKKINKKEDFIDELNAMIPPERAERAKKEAEKEIFQIRLSQDQKEKRTGRSNLVKNVKKKPAGSIRNITFWFSCFPSYNC
jgi:hypothetical protein